jgi:hypothetical protein
MLMIKKQSTSRLMTEDINQHFCFDGISSPMNSGTSPGITVTDITIITCSPDPVPDPDIAQAKAVLV